MSPAPSTPHQRVSRRLATCLTKPRLYATAGVAVYWRFELEPKPHIIVSQLGGGRLVHTLTAAAGELTMITCPFPVELDPAELARQ